MTKELLGKLLLALGAACGTIVLLEYPQLEAMDPYIALAGIALGAVGGVLQPQPGAPK